MGGSEEQFPQRREWPGRLLFPRMKIDKIGLHPVPVLPNKLWKRIRRAAISFGMFAALGAGNFGEEWVAKSWTAPHAPLGPLTDLALAKDGFLLVASGEGVRRFDGLNFSDGPEANREGGAGWQATAVFVGGSGEVWIGYRGEGVEQRAGGKAHYFGLAQNSSLRFVRAFWEDAEKRIWVGSEGGLTMIHEGAVVPQPHPPGQGVYRIKASPAGGVRVATDLGLYDLREGGWEAVATRTQLADSRVRDFAVDGEGALWIATMGGVARRVNGEQTFFTKTNGLAGDWVRRLVFDESGRLWAACQGGVSWWTGSEFKSLNGVLAKRPEVTAFVAGTAGEYWLATNSGELICLRPVSFSLLANGSDPGNSNLLSVSEDYAGKLWLGWNYFGLTQEGGERREMVTHLRDRPLNRPIALAPAREGGVWCTGSDARLFRANGGEITFEQVTGWGDSTPMSAVLEDRAGRLWVGSFDHGLAMRAGNAWTIYGEAAGLIGKRIHALHEDKQGNIWVGADGLHTWDGRRFNRWPADGKNPFGEITCFTEDGAGGLWLGTQGKGLFKIAGEKWWNYSRCHGLVEETVQGMAVDDRERIWLQGPRGVTRVRREELKELDEGKRTELTPDYWSFAEQGANTGTGTRRPTSARLRDGRMVFATTGGAAIFKPDVTPLLAGRTTVTLERLLVDGEVVARSELVEIPAGMRRLAIRWSAVNLAHPESLRFRHRLAGLDTEWLEDGLVREAHYGVLPEGNYKFELQVRDIGKSWREAIPAVAFVQLPRWHERWSIRFLLAGAVIVAWWLIHLARVRQLARQFQIVEAERHRIAGELHDTVEQGLAGIAINLDAASRQLRKAPGEAERFLASARRLVIRSRDEARQAIWEMHSAHFKTGLVGQIKHAARDLVGGTGMHWEVTVEGAIPELPDKVSRGILRIVLEAVTNAAKHSKANSLEVKLSGSRAGLVVCITDDGQGFASDGTKEPNHYGLDLMRGRAEQLGGSLEISSAVGQGTTVTFALPARGGGGAQRESEMEKENSILCQQ